MIAGVSPERTTSVGSTATRSATDPMDPMSPVKHVLKGAEDSIGLLEAIQRVYINIGSCSETCWVNHLTNFFVVDPTQRGYGQTPFNIAQCRRDCPNFRAIEDRLPEIATFLAHQRPTDLYAAKHLEEQPGTGRPARPRVRRRIGETGPAGVRRQLRQVPFDAETRCEREFSQCRFSGRGRGRRAHRFPERRPRPAS